MSAARLHHLAQIGACSRFEELRRRQDLFEPPTNSWRVQLVEDVAPFLLGADDPCVSQHLQVTRDDRAILWKARRYACNVGAPEENELLQNRDPGRLAKSLEEIGVEYDDTLPCRILT